jgi:hypothetical protein
LEGWKSRGIRPQARPSPNPHERQMIRGVAAPATGVFQKSLPVKPRFSIRPPSSFARGMRSIFRWAAIRPQSPAIPLRNADVPIGIKAIRPPPSATSPRPQATFRSSDFALRSPSFQVIHHESR